MERELFAALARQAEESLHYCVFVEGEFFEVDPPVVARTAAQPSQVSKVTAAA